MAEDQDRPCRFPRWTNLLGPMVVLGLLGGIAYGVVVLGFAVSPTTLMVGYSPKQPIPYSHALHVGQLGLDCRYCHTTVERSAFAALPPTQVCLNCHNPETKVRWDSEKLAALRTSAESGKPIPWVKVHDLADYVFFDHAAHVTSGIGCVECHGRVDQMDQVYQAKPLAMASCLDCHRSPRAHIRPLSHVTDLGWKPTRVTQQEWNQMKQAAGRLKSTRQLTDCSTCHR